MYRACPQASALVLDDHGGAEGRKEGYWGEPPGVPRPRPLQRVRASGAWPSGALSYLRVRGPLVQPSAIRVGYCAGRTARETARKGARASERARSMLDRRRCVSVSG